MFILLHIKNNSFTRLKGQVSFVVSWVFPQTTFEGINEEYNFLRLPILELLAHSCRKSKKPMHVRGQYSSFLVGASEHRRKTGCV